MDKKFTKIKAILQNPAPPKKFGTDPMEPWSATNQVSEDSIKGQRAGTLARYLKSRGINPTFVTKDQRIAHTKTDSYKKWIRDHMFESRNPSDIEMSTANKNKNKHIPSNEITTPPGTMVRKNMESDDQNDMTEMYGTSTAVFHNPLEYQEYRQKQKEKEAKEKAKPLVTNLVKKPTSTSMTVKKEGWAVNSDVIADSKTPKLSASEKMAKYGAEREKVYNAIADKQKEHIKKWNADNAHRPHLQIPVKEEQSDHVVAEDWKKKVGAAALAGALATGAVAKDNGVADAIRDVTNARTVGHVIKKIRKHRQAEKNKTPEKKDVKEQIDEISKELATSYMYSARNDRNKIDKKISDAQEKQNDGFSKKRHDNIGKLLKKGLKRTTGIQRALNKMQEDMYQDSQSATQSAFDMGNNTDDTSQTFNRVKRAMKKKHVREDTYDWEKADKSVASPGKKPKMDKSNEKDGEAVTKPKAAAVLSGGTTMTGEKRDTIEIDPSMQGRPSQDGSSGPGTKKQG